MEDVAGKVCKVLIPVNEKCYKGQGKSIAICTLGSMELLFEISKSKDIMDRILIAGRLLSENKGIDAIIRFTIKNPELNYLILCGKEVRGHNAGQAILALHRNGVNDKGIIVGAIGPSPFLNSSQEEIELFRKQVITFDLIGIDNIQEIKTSLSSMTKDDPTFSKFNYHK